MKPSTLGLLIAAVAFGASTIYLTVTLREERAQADEVLAKMQALQSRIAELETVRAEVLPFDQDEPGAAPPVAGAPGAMPAASHTVSEGVTEPPEPGRFGNRPPPPTSDAGRNVLRNNMRATARRLYEDAEEKLGLTKDQANRLIELLTDQQMARMEQMRTGGNDGRTRGRAMEPTAEDLAQISAVIGADRMALFKDYQQTLPARQEVEVITRQLEGADLSLSEDQRDRMVAALTEERTRVTAPVFADFATREEYNEKMTEWQADYNERASSRVRGILDSKQFKSYDEYQQWQLERRQQREARRNQRTQRSGGQP